MLKNVPVLILDEATSGPDSEVETAIQDQLVGLMEGKTVIAIARRLSLNPGGTVQEDVEACPLSPCQLME